MVAGNREMAAHFRVAGDLAAAPTRLDIGRVRLTDEELLCVTTPGSRAPDGPLARLDPETRQLINRPALVEVLGGDAQQVAPHDFDIDAQREYIPTISVPLASVTGIELREWEGHWLPGENHTYAVAVTSETENRPLLLQLGRGERNRGSGRARHAAFARELRDAVAAAGGSAERDEQASSEPRASEVSEAETPAGGGTQMDEEAEATAESGVAGGSEAAGSADDPAPADAATAEAEPPDGSEDMGWLARDAPPSIVVENRGEARSVTVGCRTAAGVVFTERVEFDAEETKEWQEVADEPFEVGVILPDGSETSESVDPETAPAEIRVVVDGSGIHVDATGVSTVPEEPDDSGGAAETDEADVETSDEQEQERAQAGTDRRRGAAASTPEPNGSAAASVEDGRQPESAGGETNATQEATSGPKDAVDSPDEQPQAADSPKAQSEKATAAVGDESETPAGGAPSRVSLAVLLLGTVGTVLTPFWWVTQTNEGIAVGAVVAAFPTPFSGLATYIYVQGPSVDPQISLASVILVGVVLPAVFLVDFVHVRLRTRWKPNLLLYPLGMVLLWFLTLPVYLYRRQQVAKDP